MSEFKDLSNFEAAKECNMLQPGYSHPICYKPLQFLRPFLRAQEGWFDSGVRDGVILSETCHGTEVGLSDSGLSSFGQAGVESTSLFQPQSGALAVTLKIKPQLLIPLLSLLSSNSQHAGAFDSSSMR